MGCSCRWSHNSVKPRLSAFHKSSWNHPRIGGTPIFLVPHHLPVTMKYKKNKRKKIEQLEAIQGKHHRTSILERLFGIFFGGLHLISHYKPSQNIPKSSIDPTSLVTELGQRGCRKHLRLCLMQYGSGLEAKDATEEMTTTSQGTEKIRKMWRFNWFNMS